MVNCKNCGAPLSLDNPVCPNCGTPNPEAREHLEKLAQLEKDYNKTKYEVVSEVKKNKRGYSVLTILIVVLLANLALIPLHASSYSIADNIVSSRLKVSEVKEELDRCLEEKLYDEFVCLCDKYQVSYREYEEYTPISFMANTFTNIKSYVSNFLYSNETYIDPLVKSCEYIKSFSDDYSRYQKNNSFSDFTINHLNELNSEYELFLKTFLNLNDEDIAAISSMTSADLLVLVSGRLSNEEQ